MRIFRHIRIISSCPKHFPHFIQLFPKKIVLVNACLWRQQLFPGEYCEKLVALCRQGRNAPLLAVNDSGDQADLKPLGLHTLNYLL
jgi:hypothetical protein